MGVAEPQETRPYVLPMRYLTESL